MLFTPEVRKNIATGRDTVVTDMGDEIDVVAFISHMWKHDPRLVVAGMCEAYKLKAPAGTTIQ